MPEVPLRSRLRLLAVVLFAGAVAVGIAPSADGDIWWHLAAGREMVARGQLLLTDPFSVGASGRPWADVHWLFQLVVYAVHQHFGLAGLVWAKCLVVGSGALVLLGALERKASSWVRPLFVTLFLAALFATRGLMLVRPVIVSLFFLAVFFFELEHFRRDGRTRRLLLLFLAELVWANFQGLSALGPALVFAYALAAGLSLLLREHRFWPFAPEALRVSAGSRQFRMLALTSGACLLAAGVTPFGVRAWFLPAKLLGRLLPGQANVYAHSVAENVPPFLLERWTGEFWHLKWAFGSLAVAFVCGGRRVRLSHVLLVGGLAVLALLSNRNVLLFYWLGAPIAAIYAAPALRRWALARNRTLGARLAFGLNTALLALLFLLAGSAAAREPTLDRPTPFRMPAESARALSILPSGDVFSADHQGGYLIWQLYPRFRPYLDTRLVLRSPQEFEEYLRLADEPERFVAFQAVHHFSYVLLPVAYPDRYLGLIATLYATPDWKLVYSNGSEVLFARRDIETGAAWDLSQSSVTARVLSLIERQFTDAPDLRAAARLHLATLDIALGQFAEAERVLSFSAAPDADALRARCQLGAGNIAAAQQIGERLLRRNRDDISSLNLMAQVALRRGEAAQAIPFLRRALSVDPFDGEAIQLLANLEEVR